MCAYNKIKSMPMSMSMTPFLCWKNCTLSEFFPNDSLNLRCFDWFYSICLNAVIYSICSIVRSKCFHFLFTFYLIHFTYETRCSEHHSWMKEMRQISIIFLNPEIWRIKPTGMVCSQKCSLLCPLYSVQKTWFHYSSTTSFTCRSSLSVFFV